MTRVAIIGSGPCGLSMLRSFQQAEEKGHQIPEITKNNPAIRLLLNLLRATHLQHETKDQRGKV